MEITHEFPTEVPMHEAQCLDENSKVPQHAPRPPV